MKHALPTLIIASALLLFSNPSIGAAYMKMGDIKGDDVPKDSKRIGAASTGGAAGRGATKPQPTGNSPTAGRATPMPRYKIQEAWPSKVTGGGSTGATSPAEGKR
jgi:hypothetical protein